jgi:translation initiation factor 2B subunit (eIF-2B alpha/beta/delta family)
MSAPIANAVVRAFEAISKAAGNARSVGDVRDIASKASDRLREVARENIQKTVLHASQAVAEGAAVLTHSYSETCLKALVSCVGKKITVFATESRPLFEGRKMAAGLKKGGVEVTLITDAEAGHFVRECQMVLVGADSVLSDGSVVNKMGTYLIALAAKDSDIPFRVACDSWKFRLEGGVPEPEEKSPQELGSGPSGTALRNVYFDVTPGRLVTSIITEQGARSTADITASASRWRGVLHGMLKIAGQHEKTRLSFP